MVSRQLMGCNRAEADADRRSETGVRVAADGPALGSDPIRGPARRSACPAAVNLTPEQTDGTQAPSVRPA
jgi:hypothetical protein